MKIVRFILLSVLGVFFNNVLVSQNIPTESYEGSYLFQGIYPSGLHNKDWFPDDYEVQGVTNDGENWFFTLTDQDKTHGIMWRIPRQVDLNGSIIGNPGVISVHYDNVVELNNLGFWHWGDPDHFKYDRNGDGIKKGYILVPVYGDKTPKAIACFDAEKLNFINYSIIEGIHGGWCAVGTDGDLYSSDNHPTKIKRYNISWEILTDENGINRSITFDTAYPLSHNGSSLHLMNMQGGEFSDSGEILYLVNGRGKCLLWGDEWKSNDGIHAIETYNWSQVAHSINNSETDNYFRYNYNPTCINCFYPNPFLIPPLVPIPSGSDTPEGLTVWDLEDSSVRGIGGSLHVLINRYTYAEFGAIDCNDKIYFHHYSSIINVNKNVDEGVGLKGCLTNPFRRIIDAYNYYPIWDGAQLNIKSGVYNEIGVFKKRIKITSNGGSTIIGKN